MPYPKLAHLRFETNYNFPMRITFQNLAQNGLYQRPANYIGKNTSLQRRGEDAIALCYKDEVDLVTWYAWGHIRLDAPAEITEDVVDRLNWALFDIAEVNEDSRMASGYSVKLVYSMFPEALDGFVRGMIIGFDLSKGQHTKVLDHATICKLILDNILPESARMKFD